MKEINIYSEPVKALSWREPYGSLMLPPFNKIETRTWDTKYRGLVLICLSKLDYPWNTVNEISGATQFQRILDLYDSKSLQKELSGHAVAVGRIIDCRPMRKSDEDSCFVAYHSDLYCHIYEDIRLIEPFPWKGSQGWRNVTKEQLDKIKFL